MVKLLTTTTKREKKNCLILLIADIFSYLWQTICPKAYYLSINRYCLFLWCLLPFFFYFSIDRLMMMIMIAEQKKKRQTNWKSGKKILQDHWQQATAVSQAINLIIIVFFPALELDLNFSDDYNSIQISIGFIDNKRKK